jgi:hypothetical protein
MFIDREPIEGPGTPLGVRYCDGPCSEWTTYKLYLFLRGFCWEEHHTPKGVPRSLSVHDL